MKISYLAGLCIAMTLLGCNQPLESPARFRIGQNCEVQFRRDALGAAAPNGIPPNTSSMNGAIMNIVGTLSKADANWVVVTNNSKEYMIPTHAVLYLGFDLSTPK
jgi:hypothetical protein